MIITDKIKLSQKCKDASLFESQIVIQKLERELLKSKTGVGLSANQIGIDLRICIIRIKENISLVNPIIIESFDRSLFNNEGCLSFPEEFISTARYNEIFVKDILHPMGFIATGFEAVAIQHEIDHTNGIIMYDRQIQIPQRNEKCWCKSGKRYKSCCLEIEIKNN